MHAAIASYFCEALECGGDEPPLWEGGGNATSREVGNAAFHHDSTALPKRWLGRHRTPKLREMCRGSRDASTTAVSSYSTFFANCTLGSCVVLSVVEP
jgi:hypothetical protein